MQRRRRRSSSLAATLGALGALAAPVPVAAAPDGPRVTTPAVVESLDWATATFSDPWDYANAEDALVSPNGPTFQLEDAHLADGRLRLRKDEQAGNAFLHYLVATGAIPLGRSGPLHTIDTGTYDLVTLRLWASRAVPAAVSFFECPVYGEPCVGVHPFNLQPGWQTVTVRPQDAFGFSGRWRGDVVGLRLELGDGPPAEVHVDWVRIHPDEPTSFLAEGTALDGAIWDSDRYPENNTPDAAGWGPLADLRTDGFPPGRYHLATVTGSTTTYGDTLTIRPRPRPVVLDPDVAGGEDYATAVLGNPWDFATSADALVVRADDVSFGADGLRGTNRDNDPYVRLPLAVGGIDADRYHRLTVTSTSEGDFDLRDAPGGGTHARVIWQQADTGTAFHNSNELLTFNERPTTTVVLGDPGPVPVQEPDDAVQGGWVGATITQLRWDVNEDRGPRRWNIRSIRLAADDEADASFDVRWTDPRHADGTQVAIGLAATRGGPVAHDLGSFSQGVGTNVATVATQDVPPGRWWVRLRSTAPSGAVGDGWSTGPLRVLAHVARADRIAGADRIATAVATSRAAFTSARVALVANDRTFPDALAGTALAAAQGAPILLNPAAGLDPRVRDELHRLGVEKIVLLGGVTVQAPAVEAALADVAPVVRLAGDNRFRTAAEIARSTDGRRGLTSPEVLLVSGVGFADALSAANLAAAADLPILLTRRGELPTATVLALDELDVERVTIVGGTAVVGQEVEDRLTGELALAVTRIAGEDRYLTNKAVVAAAVAAGADPTDVLVARGEDFPDALAAGAAMAERDGVLLLTRRDRVVPEVASHVRRHPPTRLQLVGGEGALSDIVARALAG